jgi:hypothetical protein
MRTCTVPGCSDPCWSSRTLCKRHRLEALMRANGPCIKHPERPAWTSLGLCSACYRKAWRYAAMTTGSSSYDLPASDELAAVVAYIVAEIVPIRRHLYLYLTNVRSQPTQRVWAAYHLLLLACSSLSDQHWTFLLKRINDGAKHQYDYISDYRGGAFDTPQKQAAAQRSQSQEAPGRGTTTGRGIY